MTTSNILFFFFHIRMDFRTLNSWVISENTQLHGNYYKVKHRNV